MSQSHNPKDSQALLQSMLQRLKLGREGQAFLHTPTPATVASSWGESGERAASNFQKVNTSLVNGFQFAANSNSAPKGKEIQQPSQCEGDGGLVSFPSQKDNTDDDTGEKFVLGQATSPDITPAGRRQLFPAKSFKDTERTDGERVSFGSSAVTRHVAGNQDTVTNVGQSQSFTPRVYLWSLKAVDASQQEGSEENTIEKGDSPQSNDIQFVTNSSFKRKQRSSEKGTRRWTQKIKERWRDRQGSFVKKRKEEAASMDQKSEPVNEVSQPVTSENMIKTSNKEEERTFPSLDSSDSSKNPPAHTEGRTRSYSDFEFGLGSFSLLDEIVTGQEWAKFLNPNLSGTSVDQRPSEVPQSQFRLPPNPDSVRSSVISKQQEVGNNQWSSWSTKTTPGSNISMAQVSPGASLSVNMEVLEGKQQESVHRQAEQSEPMDDGPMQPAQRGPGQQHRPRSIVQLQPANTLDKSRAHPNRKRQYQSSERGVERLRTEKEADREGPMCAPSTTRGDEMDGALGSQNDNFIPLYTLKSPTLFSLSSFNPLASAPRSVLKQSVSQNSESSMETMTKRRRVEENRRVRFSEDVMAIEPLEVDLDDTVSEEDSETDEDSVIEQECGEEQAPVEDTAPSRRRALPAWILALKRKNTRKK